MPELRRATTALFPDVSATLAYRLLFATYTAVVPDGVDDLSVEGLDWAGDGVVLLERLRAQIGAGIGSLRYRGSQHQGRSAPAADIPRTRQLRNIRIFSGFWRGQRDARAVLPAVNPGPTVPVDHYRPVS
jgi:hypothetical protein